MKIRKNIHNCGIEFYTSCLRPIDCYTYLRNNYTDTTGSITVVVSPLTSLMLDQNTRFILRGLKVEFVGQQQSDPLAKQNVLQGKIQLVYITPENLIDNKSYRRMLLSSVYQEKLVALVVDEVHCVQIWGEKFRESFSRIGDLRSLIPNWVRIMALTATATRHTLACVIWCLSLYEPVFVAASPYRNNIIIV